MNPRRLLMLALTTDLAGHAAALRAQAPSVALRRVSVLAPSTRAKEGGDFGQTDVRRKVARRRSPLVSAREVSR
jgi:hypothetical protein